MLTSAAVETRQIGRRQAAMLAAVILLEVTIVVAQKAASSGARGEGLRFYWSVLRQPPMWLIPPLALLQLRTWTRILAQVDLSLAYPLSSLAYPLTMLASARLFGEHLPWQVWAGVALITVGVAIIAVPRRSGVEPTVSGEIKHPEVRPAVTSAATDGLAPCAYCGKLAKPVTATGSPSGVYFFCSRNCLRVFAARLSQERKRSCP